MTNVIHRLLSDANESTRHPHNRGVRKRIDPQPELLALAEWQSGVLSTEQVQSFLASRRPVDRLVAEGRWQRLARGLYFVHDQEPPWLAWAWGGILLGGPHARLGGKAAGHLHRLNDPPQQLDVLVPDPVLLAQRGRWRFLRERPGVRSTRSPGEPPRLPLEDAVIDLTEGCTEGEVVDLITRAVQSRRTTTKRLGQCAAGRARLRHRRLLLQLLSAVAEGAESPLELKYLRDVERRHGLPRGERQRRSGHGNYWHDVRYRRYRLLVELDGRLGHDGVEAFRDMDRDNAGVVAGEITLRYGWYDTAERPCAMAFQVAQILRRQGWTGLPQRCSWCQDVPDFEIA